MTPELYRRLAATQASHWWFSARREILERIIASFHLADDAAILEIGCGAGGNLGMLSRFGRVSAVEMNDFARAHAQRTSGIDVLAGHLPDAIPFEGGFDLVCLFDVLEHVEDDYAALEKVACLMRQGGLALFTVPAYSWLYGDHDRAHGHHRRYTASDLIAKARRAGLEPLRVGYYNTFLFPLAVVKRLGERLLGRAIADETEMPSPLLNRMLRAAFTAEAPWVTRRFFPFGVSVIAVLKHTSS